MKFKLVMLYLATFSLFSCGSGDDDDDSKSDIQVRQGVVTTSVDFKYFDGYPLISDDGTKVIFTSGRDENKSLKTYRYDFSGTKKAERATKAEDDLGSEVDTALSHDGKWIAIIGVKDSRHRLYLQSFSDLDKRVEVETQDDWVISYPKFSKGSTPFLAFLAGAKGGEKRVYVVKFTESGAVVTADSPIKLLAQVDGESCDENCDKKRDEKVFTWLPLGSGYGLVSQAQSLSGFIFYKRTFTSLDNITTSKLNEEALVRIKGVDLSASKDNLLLVSEVLDNSKVVEPYGDKGDDEKKDIILQEEASTLALDGSGNLNSLSTGMYEVLSTSALDDNSEYFITGVERFSCSTAEIYGSSILLYKSGDGTKERLAISKNAEGFWELSSDPCKKIIATGDGVVQPIDTRIAFASFSKSITDGYYNLVYQTWYQNDFEVRHLKFKRGSSGFEDAVFTEISSNTL